ncbi:hypothetical protein [Herpetosiphon llansteffanensis]|uniref:hypothetical protein n=1 Tax=Herpetosiphon llansteffanensis TaxID=2094568 RepID=UPI000D7C6281|nr:hypothetical protein [Herpetosiphon llansteffanensis]
MKQVRRLASSLMLLLVMGLLVACGGSPAETPEVRSENFLKDFVAGINDPALGEAAKQEEIADKLAGYFAPDQRATQKAALLEQLQQMAPMGGKIEAKLENVKFEKVSESGDTAVVKISGGTMVMAVDGQSQSIDLADGGIAPGASGNESTLKKVDNVWYIVP